MTAPFLINGYLEASYPSSTTLLALCVLPTAMMQLNGRLPGRLLSGVHWLTDILGGALLSAGLGTLYAALVRLRPFSGSGDR